MFMNKVVRISTVSGTNRLVRLTKTDVKSSKPNLWGLKG